MGGIFVSKAEALFRDSPYHVNVIRFPGVPINSFPADSKKFLVLEERIDKFADHRFGGREIVVQKHDDFCLSELHPFIDRCAKAKVDLVAYEMEVVGHRANFLDGVIRAGVIDNDDLVGMIRGLGRE